MAQDMRIRKGRTRVDNDRERRLNQVLGESKSPEEALVKRCSHFTLDDLTEGKQNALQACDIVVKERQSQYDNLILDLKKSLRRAILLKNECPPGSNHFDWWVDNVPKNAAGDLEATGLLYQMIGQAKEKYGGRSKRPANRAKKGPTEDTDEGSGEEVDRQLESAPEKLQALRGLAGHLRRLGTELVSRTRSLRFFEVVRQLQRARSGQESSKVSRTCSKCKTETTPDMISVLGLCGHTACQKCLGDRQRSGECVVLGCNAAAEKWSVVKATELGEEDQNASVGRHYGKKLEAVVNLLKNEIPKDDQVILFVQFNDLMAKVSAALTDHGISHYAVGVNVEGGKGKKNTGNQISDFQDETGSKKKKVLMLNVADESASGA